MQLFVDFRDTQAGGSPLTATFPTKLQLKLSSKRWKFNGHHLLHLVVLLLSPGSPGSPGSTCQLPQSRAKFNLTLIETVGCLWSPTCSYHAHWAINFCYYCCCCRRRRPVFYYFAKQKNNKKSKQKNTKNQRINK